MSNDDLQLGVSFYTLSVQDEVASKEEGRPIFRDVEMVKIQFPGNRLNEHHAPATDTSYLGSKIGHVAYKDRFPKHYAAFLAGKGDEVIGTPLGALNLSDARIAELRALSIRTVEMLAGLTEVAIQKAGRGTRDDVEAAKAFLAANTGNTLVAELQARIAQLEAAQAAAGTDVEPVAEPEDEFSDLSNEDIKATIRSVGGTVPSGTASRKTLVEALRKATA